MTAAYDGDRDVAVTGAVASGPVVVLRNPLAGRGRGREALAVAVARLRAGGRQVVLIDAPDVDAAARACRRAVRDGVAALVAAGGDGTVNLALQAVAGTGVGFGVLPAGTGNDFAAALGVPGDLAAAADGIVRALDEGGRRAVDLGRITSAASEPRWFGAVLAAGFDAIVNERANRMRFPRGRRRYDLAILAELARLSPRRYTLRLDGVTRHVDAVLVAVGNTASYGGGMRVCPDADPADGLLDVVVAGPLGRGALMRLKPRVHTGTHVAHPLVDVFRARSVEVDADGIVAYADGERIAALPIAAECVPGALSLLAN